MLVVGVGGADDASVLPVWRARGQKGQAVQTVVRLFLDQAKARNNECRPADTMSYQYATSYSTSKDERRLTTMWQRLVRQSQYDAKGKPRTRLAIVRRRLLTLPTAIFVLWFFVLLWGERSTFSSSIAACKWDQWEKWVCPAHASPHRHISNRTCSPQTRSLTALL